MFQTWWDTNQQIIRKAIDYFAGAASGWLVSQGEWGAALAPLVVVAVNFVWFWLANRNKITVAGLEASTVPGTTAVAATIQHLEEKAKEQES